MSDITNVVAQLEQQREAIDRAISALRGIDGTSRSRAASKGSPAKAGRRKRHLSAEGRANIIAAIKKRWAAKRAAEGKAATKSTPKKRKAKRVLSAEARKKMAEAARKRWAVRKKAQGT